MRLHGLVVTDPIDTWLGLAPMLTVDELIVAGDRLIGLPNPFATLGQVTARVHRHGGARGVKRLRAALDEMVPGSRSPRETRTRLDFIRAGLPEPELNASIPALGGASYTGDIVYRSQRVVFEYEGDQHRTDEWQWAHDLTRYNALTEAGWQVIRIAKRMPRADVTAMAARILAAR